MRKTKNTYAIHRYAGSWTDPTFKQKMKQFIIRNILGVSLTDKLVQLKRKMRI